MKQIDRYAINKIINDENITNMTMITYLTAIAISKFEEENGAVINNFNQYRLYKSMNDEMDWINETSVRNAYEYLLEKEYFIEDTYINEIGKEKTRLLIVDTAMGHITSDKYYKNDGYITLHKFLYTKVFFNLSLRAKKLTLEILSRFGNDATKSVKLNFKSKKGENTFISYCKKLKVNRLAHIKNTIEELKKVFNISELLYNTFSFTLNDISEITLNDNSTLFELTKNEIEQTKKILKEKNIQNHKFTLNQIREIAKALKGYTMRTGRIVLGELCLNSRSYVGNLYGYTKAIMQRLFSERAFV